MRMEWCGTCQAVADFIQEANRKCEFSIVAIVDCYNIAEGKTGPYSFLQPCTKQQICRFSSMFLGI